MIEIVCCHLQSLQRLVLNAMSGKSVIKSDPQVHFNVDFHLQDELNTYQYLGRRVRRIDTEVQAVFKDRTKPCVNQTPILPTDEQVSVHGQNDMSFVIQYLVPNFIKVFLHDPNALQVCSRGTKI